MAVADILISLFGSYTPTGVYSFEFRQSSGQTIAEIFFLTPPKSVSVKEPQRSKLTPTLSGGYLTDYGNEFKPIDISGETHFFYAGTTNSPSKEFAKASNLGLEDFIDGYSEFIKLRWMLGRYRDYTMTKNGKLFNVPSFGKNVFNSSKALKTFVEKQIENGKGALADKLDVIWHDYDYDDHFFIKVEEFSFARDDSDLNTIKYNISLVAYQVDDRKHNLSLISFYKLKTVQLLRELQTFIADMHVASIPEEIFISTAAGIVPIQTNTGSTETDPPTQTGLNQISSIGGLL